MVPSDQVLNPSLTDNEHTIDEPDQQKSAPGSDDDVERLSKTLLDDDKESFKQGNILNDAMNHNTNSLVPDLMFEKMVKNYKMAEQIYGPKLLRAVSGYSSEQLERNINVPEFQNELKHTIGSTIKSMKKDGLLDKDGTINEEGILLASLVMYADELDKLTPKGMFGEHTHKFIKDPYGMPTESRKFRKGDRFSDIDAGKSVKVALRRGHTKIRTSDLRVQDRVRKGNITVVYAIDASGSMRGRKIEMAKRAGVALGYKATTHNDAVGLVVFSGEIKHELSPTKQFLPLLKTMGAVQAGKETNMKLMLRRVVHMLQHVKGAKHLLVLTDGAPTVGPNPQEATLRQAMVAREAGITISVVGIQLKGDDEEFVRRLADVGGGKVYLVQDVENLDVIVLQDYGGLI